MESSRTGDWKPLKGLFPFLRYLETTAHFLFMPVEDRRLEETTLSPTTGTVS